MVEYFPAARLRANGSGVATEFSARVHDLLSLDELVDLFAGLAALEGVVGHRCLAVRDGTRDVLFGRAAQSGSTETLSFAITGWDECAYEMELALLPGAADPARKAELHAMAALCVARGIALCEADDDLCPMGLTGIEQACLDQRHAGLCDLDIAEGIGRSVHAVRIHAERAERKLRSALRQG